MSLPFFSAPARTRFHYNTNCVVCMETASIPCRFLVIDDFGLGADSSLRKAVIEAAGEHALLADVTSWGFQTLRALAQTDSPARIQAWAGLERLISCIAQNGDWQSPKVHIEVLDITRDALALDRDREASSRESLLRAALASRFVGGQLARPVSLIVLGFPLTLRAPEDCMLLHYVTALGNAFLANTLAGTYAGDCEEEELFDWLEGPGMRAWNDLRARPEAAATAVAVGSLRTSGSSTSAAVALAIHAVVSCLRYDTPAHIATNAPFPAEDLEASFPPRVADELRRHGLVTWTGGSSGRCLPYPVTLASKGELDLGVRLLTYHVARTAQAMMHVADPDYREAVEQWLKGYTAEKCPLSPIVRTLRPFSHAEIRFDEPWPDARFHIQLQLHGQSETSLGLTRVSGYGDGRHSPPSPL